MGLMVAEPLSAEEQMTLERIELLSEIIESEGAYVGSRKSTAKSIVGPLRPGICGVETTIRE